MDIHNLVYLVLLTFLPGVELRLSIPVGLWNTPIPLPFVGTVNGLGLPLLEVLLVVIIANLVLGIFLFFALDFLVRLFTRVQFIKEIYNRLVARTQKRVGPYVEKYGTIGLALFIAIPLIGSGVWTGAFAAYLLGMRFRKFLVAEIIGVLIAGAIVTLISLGLLTWIG